MNLPELSDLLELAKQKRLRFNDALEETFQDYFFENFLWINRIGLLMGLILWCLFGLIDLVGAPLSYRQAWLIRYGMGAPVIILVILTTFRPIYRQMMRPLSALITLTAGLGVIAIVRLAQPTEPASLYYIFGLMVILVFLYTVPGTQFGLALVVTLLLLAIQPLAYLLRFDGSLSTNLGPRLIISNAFLVTLGIVGLIGLYFFELSIRRNFIQRLIIQKEEDRSNALLLNVLPAPAAERLKRGERIADYYPAISVLFADIVGFTPLSSHLSPDQVVNLLNTVFSSFDRLTEQSTLEKIKTIGDAYMVVSGLPVPRPDHAQILASLALEMQAEIGRLEIDGVRNLQVRIGLHSGPAVAGVIGWNKFAYDLWGDTVNTASRMESHGLPGRIQVSQATYELLKDQYQFEARGEIEVKGKGKMCAYWLVRKITPEEMVENRLPSE